MLFPSKENTTWEGFQRPFKDGDIVYVKTINHHEYILIFKEIKNDHIHKYVCFTYQRLSIDKCPVCQLAVAEIMRLATEEEKAKLFQAIKENGYYWDAETKTLEKLVKPKFKVGDKIRHDDGGLIYTIDGIYGSIYGVKELDYGIPIAEQDDWELVSNIEPKFKVGDKIVKKGDISVTILISEVDDECYYSTTEGSIGLLPIAEQDDWELVPNKFDTTTLKPFESRVLVRDYDHQCWKVSFFGYFDKFMGKFDTVRGVYIQCIPYEGNEHLLGKTDDCEEYFKTW
jgi:hypothetical protein